MAQNDSKRTEMPNNGQKMANNAPKLLKFDRFFKPRISCHAPARQRANKILVPTRGPAKTKASICGGLVGTPNDE